MSSVANDVAMRTAIPTASRAPIESCPSGLILGLDLGKFKSVGCLLDPLSGTHRFVTIPTSPADLRTLLGETAPDRLVIEACNIAGWVHDLARSLSIEVEVANTNDQAWKWKRVKRKTDRDDALKLATMSNRGELPSVYMPEPQVRQWKALIKYRHVLIDRRTGIKNTIRSLLDAQGLSMPARSRGWTIAGIEELTKLIKPLEECEPHELWRGELESELKLLATMAAQIKQVDAKLDELQRENAQVTRLKTIPGVGNRLAELVVSTLDDPKRFANAAQVGAYAGLVPKLYESGIMKRQGRITGCGPGLLRRVLVQVAWGMQKHEGRGKAVFERLCHGQRTRRKQAAVALARKILIWCWALLKNQQDWDEERARDGERQAEAVAAVT